MAIYSIHEANVGSDEQIAWAGASLSSDFEFARRAFDIAEVARCYTTLNRSGQGPCPICGGRDRFYILNSTRCGCRKCPNPISAGDKTWDAVGLVAEIEQISMRDALNRLTVQSPVIQAKHVIPSPPSPLTDMEWQARARKIVENSTSAILGPSGLRGREYLASRSLRPETWKAFQIGYFSAKFDPATQSRRPAVVIPWQAKDMFASIKFRFIDGPHVGSQSRFSQIKGSKPSLFGLHLVARHSTIIAVEGEFNAMSVWQAFNGQADVVSIGAQKNGESWDSLVRLVERVGYEEIVIWVDEARIAHALATRLGRHGRRVCIASSPGSLDANDVLVKMGREQVREVVDPCSRFT